MLKIKDIILDLRRVLIFLTHLFIVILSFWTAFLLRFDFKIPPQYQLVFYEGLLLLAVTKMVVFAVFGIFSGLWRYVSINDAWRIIKASVVATGVFILGEVFLFELKDFPRVVFIADWLICTGLILGVRIIARLIRERYYQHYDLTSKKIIVVGAGETGSLFLRACQKNHTIGQVVGFIDDDPIKLNESIRGIKILGSREDIPRIAEKYAVAEIILAIPSIKGNDMRGILSYCEKTKAKIKIIPGMDKVFGAEPLLKPREVRVEDLIGREQVSMDTKEISSYIKDKVVLVTGAGGSIGSEICRQIAHFEPKEIVFLDHNENSIYFLNAEFDVKYPKLNSKTYIGSICDVGLLKDIFSKHAPQIVFHSAAHKHVPLMEENPVAAVKNNIIGTQKLIYAAHHYKVERFVLISTDKAVNPINIMGMSKRISEMILQSKAKRSKTKFMAVRFGNVFGSSGSVALLFKKQIEEGGPVTVTNPEVKRYFMSAKEAVMLVLQAGAMGSGGELFILDMGEQIKILDIAKNLIILSGLVPSKDIMIRFIGLRPGEKLQEELLLDKEKDSVTRHHKIYISQPEEFDPVTIRRKIKRLTRLAETMDTKRLIEEMRQIIQQG